MNYIKFNFLSTLLLLILSVPVVNAQSSKAETSENMSCKEVVDYLYNKLETSSQIKYKEGDKVSEVSKVSSSTLSNSSDIKEYFKKITAKQNYYYKYEPAIKKVALKEGSEIFGNQNKQSQQAFSFLKKKLSSALQLGNEVFVTKLETEDGQVITDYTVCSPKNKEQAKISYNNAFLGILFFKTKASSNERTTINQHH